jgi:hyaluronate lyase
MLSMCSPNIARYECFLWSETNRENPNGWYTGAGMLYVYADSVTQYDQAFHRYADHYRLPGTTVDTRERNPLNNAGTFNQSAFVGGVQMDIYAAAAFQYDNMNGDFDSDLVAKKSYFFFDNEIVCLGAGITSTIEKACDIGMSSRALKAEELAQGLTETTIAMDGIAVIVNNNNAVEELTSEQIRQIFTGEVTDWAALQ